MIAKIFASLILISVLYILGVFLAPNLSDSLADRFGTQSINTIIRQFKDGADTTSTTLLQIKDASGAINNVRGIMNQVNDTINQTSETINSIRQTGEQKVQQVQKTADSIRRATEAVTDVQSNISELTSFSGSKTSSGAPNPIIR